MKVVENECRKILLKCINFDLNKTLKSFQTVIVTFVTIWVMIQNCILFKTGTQCDCKLNTNCDNFPTSINSKS